MSYRRSRRPLIGRKRPSSAGSMFATLLVVAAVVELLLSIPAIGVVVKIPGVPILLAILGVALLAALLFDIDRTNTLISVLGVVVLGATLGLAGTVEAVIIAALLSWLLGAMRRWRK